MTAFLLSVALQPVPVQAATATASVSAEIISPAVVSVDAASDLLFSASTGVLTLTIPGAGSSADAEVKWGMKLTSTGLLGNPIIFSTNDITALTTLSSALEISVGSFGVNGMLGTGQGFRLFVTQIVQGDTGTTCKGELCRNGTVYAIVAYN